LSKGLQLEKKGLQESQRKKPQGKDAYGSRGGSPEKIRRTQGKGTIVDGSRTFVSTMIGKEEKTQVWTWALRMQKGEIKKSMPKTPERIQDEREKSRKGKADMKKSEIRKKKETGRCVGEEEFGKDGGERRRNHEKNVECKRKIGATKGMEIREGDRNYAKGDQKRTWFKNNQTSLGKGGLGGKNSKKKSA